MADDTKTRIVPKFEALLRKENKNPFDGIEELAWRALYLLERKLTDDGAHIPEGCRLESYREMTPGSHISSCFRFGEVTRRVPYRGFCIYAGKKDNFGMTIRLTDPPGGFTDLIFAGRRNLPSLLERAYVAQEDPSSEFTCGKILKSTDTDVTLLLPLRNHKAPVRGKIADYWIPLWHVGLKPLVITVRAYKDAEDAGLKRQST